MPTARRAAMPRVDDAAERKRRPFRRDEILTVAIDLFHEQGYHATGMDEIGAAAGITGPGIYRHFKNKDDILDAALRKGVVQIIGRVEGIVDAGDPPEKTLRALIQNYLRAVLNQPALAALVITERRLFPPKTRAWFDRADRLHVEEWVHVLSQLRPETSDADIRLMVSAAMGLLSSGMSFTSGLDRAVLEKLLTDMAFVALIGDVRSGRRDQSGSAAAGRTGRTNGSRGRRRG